MAEPNQDDVQVEQRRAPRFALAMDVHVRARGSHQSPARLTSMSRFGCRVVSAGLSKSDDLVWVRMPGLESQAAELRWFDQSGAGLAFHYPLHVAVADLFREPDVELERSYRPGRRPTEGFGLKLPC